MMQHFTAQHIKALADGDSRKRAVIHLGEGDSVERLDSGKSRRIYGPAVVITDYYEDGGIHQSVRDPRNLPRAVSRNLPTAEQQLKAAQEHAGVVPVTAWGETKSIYAWSRDARCAVSPAKLYERIHGGIPAERAISTPATARRSNAAQPEWRGDLMAVRVPRKIVDGLVAQEAMRSNDATDHAVARMLEKAEVEQLSVGARAVVVGTAAMLDHLAAYLESLTGAGSEFLHVFSRFGFTRPDAERAASKIRAQIRQLQQR